MNREKSRCISNSPTLIVAAALLLGNASVAETLHFRVAFERVPGAEEVQTGNIQAGIEILEDQLARVELQNSGDLLATLCAAHIVNGSLDKAEHVCNKAVQVGPTKAAYNNRGVFRAFTGDLSGAREDFARVRPPRLETYFDELRATDVPLVADDNFHLVVRLLSKRITIKDGHALASSASSTENTDENVSSTRRD